MPTITFLPSGVSIEVKPGTTVFQAAARAEVPIASQCGGKCACALCRVKVMVGEELISPMTWEEEGHMGNAFFITKQRLSCQLQVFGDVTIEVAEPEVREKPRGHYVPRSLQKKREELEREADRAEAVGGGRGRHGGLPRGQGPASGPVGPQGAPGGSKKDGDLNRRRRKRSRNPGTARSGDTRPPPGAKKKN